MSDTSLLITFPLALVSLPVTATIARQRGRQVGRWVLASVLVWWVVIPLLLLLPRGSHVPTEAAHPATAWEEALIVLGFACFGLLAVMGVYAAVA